MEKEDVIKLIADRIRSEQCKHGHTIDQWPEIAAAKIYKQLSKIFTNSVNCNIQEEVEPDYVWAFDYLDCIFEGSWSTESLHKTEEGAVLVLEEHKKKLKEGHDTMYKDLPEEDKEPFGEFESWRVRKIKILK